MDIYTFLVVIAFFITVIALTVDDNKIKSQVISVLSKILGKSSDNKDNDDC